jgi:hypothetical protein
VIHLKKEIWTIIILTDKVIYEKNNFFNLQMSFSSKSIYIPIYLDPVSLLTG